MRALLQPFTGRPARFRTLRPMQTSQRLNRIDSFDHHQAVRVVVEASAGMRSKLKYSPSLGAFEVHHVLPAGMVFPHDFGFIPSTLGDDGDPLDALVFADESLPTGTVVPCRLIGVLQATQSSAGKPPARNDRFLAVAREGSQYAHWSNLGHVPEAVLAQLEHFFVSYNEQRGIEFRPVARGDAAAAMLLLEQGRDRLRQRS